MKRIIALILISVFILAAGCSAENGPQGELEPGIKLTDTAAEPTPSSRQIRLRINRGRAL